jgi:gibberellin 2-oxidase
MRWLAHCRRDLKAFFTPMHELSRFIVEELTEALGLSRDTFTRLEATESNSNCTGRMNHYPMCPEPDAVLGIPSHGDTQMMAILHQDDIGGLQVLKDGQWVGIRPDDTTFVVNVGDTFMVLSPKKTASVPLFILSQNKLHVYSK